MKVFTTGRYGRVPGPLSLSLGISAESNHRQARVLVAAPNKREAHLLLSAVGLGVNYGNPDFRQAMGNDVDCLTAAGLLGEPVVLAKGNATGPVAKVEPDGYTIIGSYKADAGIFEPAEPYEVARQRKELASALRTSTDRLNRLEAELAHERVRRGNLCLTAVDAKMVDTAAEAMEVTPGRVYQLATDARRRLASMGDFRPGVR